MDNETWIIDSGEEIIEKKSEHGVGSLTPKERLIYCLWVADYSVRNAGDLEAAYDIYPAFLNEGLRLSKDMNLGESIKLFGYDKQSFPEHFYDLFDNVCNEIRNDTQQNPKPS